MTAAEAILILVAMTVSCRKKNNNQKGELPSDLGHVPSFKGLGSFFLSTRSLEDPGSCPLLTKSSKVKEDFVEKKQDPESSKDFVEKKEEPEPSKEEMWPKSEGSPPFFLLLFFLLLTVIATRIKTASVTPAESNKPKTGHKNPLKRKASSQRPGFGNNDRT